MIDCIRCRFSLVLLSFVGVSMAGCESLYDAGVPGMERFVDLKSRAAEEERYRQNYQVDKSPAALQWLLANRVDAGMTVPEVNRILGEEGVREFSDSWIKTKGGHYHSGDTVYKWSSDSEGKTLYLVFRGGHLVNFDRNAYRDPLAGSSWD